MNFESSIKQELYKYLILHCKKIDNLYVAFSGGVDSCVLLDGLTKLNSLLNLKKNITAIHVNHNISKNSYEWENFCHEFCKKIDIKIYSHEVNLKVKKDETLESVARLARYNIFKKYLNSSNDILITAHHQNDQAETILLNLFRGSGLDGLAGINIISDINNSKLLRPLLNINKDLILEYARENNLDWVEDESNNSLDYSRNFLRNEIIPKLQSKWPAIISKISHSSNHCYDAKKYIEENIVEHYNNSISKDKFEYNILDIDYLKTLSISEQKYLLRYFIKKQGGVYPSKIKLDEILRQSLNAKPDSNIGVTWKKDSDNYEIKRYKNKIYLLKNFNNSDKTYKKYNYTLNENIYIEEINKQVKLYQEDLLINKNIDKSERVELNFRKNINANKTMVIRQNKKKISLKKYFQESDIPPWVRDRVILVMIDNEVCKLIY